MGIKSKNAGTTKYRVRSSFKKQELVANDISKIFKGGRGSRSAKRKQKQQYVRERISRALEYIDNQR